MSKLLVLSLLLTLVYSWDQFSHFLRKSIWAILRGRPSMEYPLSHLDELVGSAIMLTTLPFSLAYALEGREPLKFKLAVLAVELLLIVLCAAASEFIFKQIKSGQTLSVGQSVVMFGLNFAAFLSPARGLFVSSGAVSSRLLVKIAGALALAPLTGLAAVGLLDYAAVDGQLRENLDILITVLVTSLLLRISLEFMGFYFHTQRFDRLTTYYRIIFGIILTAFVLNSSF